MGTPVYNLTEDEVRERIHRGDMFTARYNNILSAVRKHYDNQENKRAIGKFIEILSWWFKNEEECKVKGHEIILGNYDRDQWVYVINWTNGRVFSRFAEERNDEEMAEWREEQRKKEQKVFERKCKQFGINPKWKDKVLTNKDGEIIQFVGFGTKRKMPVRYKDLKTDANMVCTIKYFKEFKLKKEEK